MGVFGLVFLDEAHLGRGPTHVEGNQMLGHRQSTVKGAGQGTGGRAGFYQMDRRFPTRRDGGDSTAGQHQVQGLLETKAGELV